MEVFAVALERVRRRTALNAQVLQELANLASHRRLRGKTDNRVRRSPPLDGQDCPSYTKSKQFFRVGYLRRAKARAALALFLANLLAEHGGVVPAKAQLRIRSVPSEHPQRFGALRIVKQKDVAFLAFDQGQHVDVVVHDRDSIHSGGGVGGMADVAGLAGESRRGRIAPRSSRHPLSRENRGLTLRV